MKVLHIIDGIGPPGARGPELIYSHLKKMAGNGVDVHILTLITDEYTAGDGYEWARRQKEKYNIKIYFIKNPFIKTGHNIYKIYLIFTRIWYFFRALLLAWRNKYDIINDFSSSALMFYRTALLGLFSGARVIHTLCTYNLGFFSSYRFFGGMRYLDAVICFSAHMADKINLFPQAGKKVHCLPLGVEWQKFNAVKNSSEIRGKYALPADKIKILYLGPIKKDKGVFVLSEAACKIPAGFNVHFVFACARFLMSEREKKQRIMMLNKSLNSCRQTFQIISEWVDVPALMKECEVVVVPQLTPHGTIAYPVTLLEAMAAGKAVIASSTEGVEELIKHEQNGLLFKSGSSDELAEYIKLLAKNQQFREKLGNIAKDDIQAKHDLAKAASNLVKIYTELNDNAKRKV